MMSEEEKEMSAILDSCLPPTQLGPELPFGTVGPGGSSGPNDLVIAFLFFIYFK